jgi:hypothetical protein
MAPTNRNAHLIGMRMVRGGCPRGQHRKESAADSSRAERRPDLQHGRDYTRCKPRLRRADFPDHDPHHRRQHNAMPHPGKQQPGVKQRPRFNPDEQCAARCRKSGSEQCKANDKDLVADSSHELRG